MTENTSLDDFADAGDDQEVAADGSTDRGETGGGEADREEASAGDAAPADAGSVAADSEDADTAVAEATSEDGHQSSTAVDPARATYDWTPGGATCEACEAVVERRWRDDPGFVCGDCKDW